MSQWTDVDYNIPRRTDAELVARLEAIFTESELEPEQLECTLFGGGPVLHVPWPDRASHPDLQTTLAVGSKLIQSLKANFAGGRISIRIARTPRNLTDQLTISLGGLNQPHSSYRASQLRKLIQATKTQLPELLTADHLALLGQETKRHYEAREASLAELQDTLAQVVRTFTHDLAVERQSLLTEVAGEREHIKAQLQQREAELEQDQERQRAALEEREAQLEQRLAEIDAQAARHARRKLREDLKKELATRSDKFQLTDGTRRLRLPVHCLAFALLGVFGIGLLYSFSMGFESPYLIARHATLGVAFGSTAIFYLRWLNSWFEQHATEEFRLKRLALDVDRASWVVEMAMEWTNEKGADLPHDLLDRLTGNLFEDQGSSEAPLHPADELASALLGSSSELTLDLPNGKGTIKLDRRGVKNLFQRVQNRT